MESIKFYKLISPYAEDITMNCKLSMTDIDDNFLAFKDNDISAATFDCESFAIDIVRNNGETINIDLSCVKDEIDNEIYEAISGITPEGVEINISGELSDDGILTLNWTDISGSHSTSISGFVCEASELWRDTTLNGDGSKTNPLGISDVEKTGYYKPVLDIVEELPTEGVSIGDRYVTPSEISNIGKLYSKDGMEEVKESLEEEGSAWRIPTKEDWDKLLNYAEVCADWFSGETGTTITPITPPSWNRNITSGSTSGYVGTLCGKMLKSVEYWEGNENIDYYGFTAYPSGYISGETIYGIFTDCRFWVDTEYEDGYNYIKGFTFDSDASLEEVEEDDSYYSIRLVMDADKAPSDTVNILGNTYKVIYFPEIKQAWIRMNLNYECESYFKISDGGHGPDIKKKSNSQKPNCVQIYGDIDGLIIGKYKINHWNGNKWVSKELNVGDKFNTIDEDSSNGRVVVEYTCDKDNYGNQHLVRGIIYTIQDETKKMIIDAGWY